MWNTRAGVTHPAARKSPFEFSLVVEMKRAFAFAFP